MIKRRVFCGSALAAMATAALPISRLMAAATAPISSDIAAINGAGQRILLPRSDIEDLRAALRGALLLPGDEDYDRARRIWNGAFDRHPAIIARCAGGADVIQAVNFGRAHDLLVAVRGGGHSFSGQSVCEGGLMIDLSPMKSIRVDPLGKTARLEPGVLLNEFDREAQAFGLATTAGTISHTGVAGLTLGGGFGRLCRKYGLACDNLMSVDLVAANGQFLKASAGENPDLFWGVRGGGGNFGVVTSFEFQLHVVAPTLLGGVLIFPLAQARDVLDFFAGFASSAPDELNTDVLLTTLPDGQRVVLIDVCWCGSIESGERALKPLRQFRKSLEDTIAPTPYVRLQSSGDTDYPIGRRYYFKSGFVGHIDRALVEEMVARFESSPLSSLTVVFVHHGGAVRRIPRDATAFWHRDAGHSVILESSWDNPLDADKNTEWVRSTWRALEPFTDGFYVNELAPDETERRIRANYGANYDRLVGLKSKFDPSNLFRMNANVKPSGHAPQAS